MVKIETAPQISQDFPQGKSQEFIWMDGQPWPVSAEDDARLIRVEAFGDELETMKRFSGGQPLAIDGKVTCRTWYLDEARYLSEQMRVFYP